MSVCLSVCLSVRLFTFEVPFKRLFAPTSQSQMSNVLRDSESLGNKMERSGLRFEHFSLEVVKNRKKKKKYFLADFAYKTRWKPCFPMDKRPLVKGRIPNFSIFLDVFEFLRF